RLRPIGVFSNQASCERIAYSVVYRLNKYWEDNPIKEFTQNNLHYPKICNNFKRKPTCLPAGRLEFSPKINRGFWAYSLLLLLSFLFDTN
ncbi:MAG: hypothetical protein LWW90_06715, partial [Candidatus Desulfofervidus auxilii]|nr:hypothetical protein [Candidatus Desulfofervidus auxilii]